MITFSKVTRLFNTAMIAQAIESALVVMLIIALLLFVWLAPIRYAYGGIEVFSEGAAIMAPMAADGIVAIISATLTAAAVVWLYLRRLAH